MRTPTLTDAGAPATQIPPRHNEHPDPGDPYRRLWAMTRDERIAAMWRGELTTRQLCQWSSRAQHEIPLLGNEFAWIAMRTPEWAEASNMLDAHHVPAERKKAGRRGLFTRRGSRQRASA
ncbi:MAG: hypothetical protein M3Y09_04520 [Actinomycetota bacterium]|nr:hypothetical protein [Actinomycetota bacterium]